MKDRKYRVTRLIAVAKAATKYIPDPNAIPTPATTQIVAATKSANRGGGGGGDGSGTAADHGAAVRKRHKNGGGADKEEDVGRKPGGLAPTPPLDAERPAKTRR